MGSKRWLIGIGAAGLVVGLLLGFWIFQLTLGSALRFSAQGNLMEGYGLIREGEAAWNNDDKNDGRTWITEGVTYLFASSSALDALGVPDMDTIAPYMQHAEGQLVAGNIDPRQMYVIRTFLSSLQPLSHTGWGAISDSSIAKALGRVNAAISSVTSEAH